MHSGKLVWTFDAQHTALECMMTGVPVVGASAVGRMDSAVELVAIPGGATRGDGITKLLSCGELGSSTAGAGSRAGWRRGSSLDRVSRLLCLELDCCWQLPEVVGVSRAVSQAGS